MHQRACLSYLDGVLIEVEPLLDEGGELANAAALLAEHVLGAGGENDDLGPGRGHADLNTRVAADDAWGKVRVQRGAA